MVTERGSGVFDVVAGPGSQSIVTGCRGGSDGAVLGD
jgi:hypothetical protein